MKAVYVLLLLQILAMCTTEGILTNSLKYTINHGDQKHYTDCDHVRKAGYNKSGVYQIWLNESTPIEIHCRHDVKRDVSYHVIQCRKYGNVNFNRGWNDYVKGFGDLNSDYWAGLNQIFHLTNTGYNILTIDMSDWSGNKRNVRYSYFKIADAQYYYRLSVSGFSGQVPDDLSFNNNMTFATYDYLDHTKCAANHQCGWWFNHCSLTLPNGIYYHDDGPYTPTNGFYNGIYWRDWMGYGYSLKSISLQLSK